MATKGYVLKVLVPTPGVGEHVSNIKDFKELLQAMQTPEDEIMERVRSAVEFQKQQMIDLGFSEEEAEDKIQELIEKEINGIEEAPIEEPEEEEEDL
jgi:hypothetical protein